MYVTRVRLRSLYSIVVRFEWVKLFASSDQMEKMAGENKRGGLIFI